MKRWMAVLVLVAIFGLLVPSLCGQATTGTIYGRVVDSSGLAVPGADVVAVNEQTATQRTTLTTDRGEFTLTYLPSGSYTITIEMPGFKRSVSTNLRVSSGQRIERTFTLQVGTPDEVITVTSSAVLLNSVSAEQEVNLGTEQLESLSVNRRDITGLLNLGTGLAPSGGQISMNGLPPNGFSFSVDGVDASPDTEFNSMSMYGNFNYIKGVSMDAVAEVEVSKNIFAAEIGQTLSGNVNVITKTGTNDFHGSLFEYYQSGGLMARNHFSDQKAPQVFHQFGGSLGGPIIKDKIFFFGVYEGYRLNAKSVQSGNVPSNWLRNQLTDLPGADTWFSLWPNPTGAEQEGDRSAFYSGVHTESRNDDHFSVRGDANITDRDLLNVRFTLADPDFVQPRLMIGNPRDRVGVTRNFYATYTRSVSDLMTSELRFGYNFTDHDRVDRLWQAGVPSLTVASSPSSGGELFIKKGTSYTIDNSWSLVQGSHTMKFGGLFKHLETGRINEEVPNFTFDTVEDALLNIPSEGEFQFALEEFLLTTRYVGFFFQDDWRITPSLVLNLGIRWDYSGVTKERDGRFFNQNLLPFEPFAANAIGDQRDPDQAWEPNYTDFSPRFSFAWTVDDAKTTVVRGGYGIFYIPFNMFAGPVEIVKNALNEPVEAQLARDELLALGITYPTPNEDVKPLVQASAIDSDSKIDPNWDTSYSQQWNFGVQRQFLEDMVVDLSYVGNHGTKIIYSPRVNRLGVNGSGIGEGGRPWDGFGEFRSYSTADSTTYHSLQASLKKRFSRNFAFNSNYTWASNFAYFRGDLSCCGTSENPQDLYNLDNNKGPTSFHIRHRFTTDLLWTLPWGNDMQGAARYILGGWEMSSLLEIRSGDPINVLQGSNRTPGARPDFVGASHDAAINDDWGTSVNGVYTYLFEDAFSLTPLASNGNLIRPGTMGRRSLYGPGEWTVDVALAKGFAVTETSQLKFRADFFNFFNKTNLGGPRSNITSSNFGVITGASAGRVVQLSLRYDF